MDWQCVLLPLTSTSIIWYYSQTVQVLYMWQMTLRPYTGLVTYYDIRCYLPPCSYCIIKWQMALCLSIHLVKYYAMLWWIWIEGWRGHMIIWYDGIYIPVCMGYRHNMLKSHDGIPLWMVCCHMFTWYDGIPLWMFCWHMYTRSL